MIASEGRAAEFACSPKRDLTFVRGSLATLWDEAGKEYIDCGASVGVGNLGHCNPAVAEAIAAQAHQLIHVGPSFGTAAKSSFTTVIPPIPESNTPMGRSLIVAIV